MKKSLDVALQAEQSLVVTPKDQFDLELACAAIEELRPVCRAVVTLYVWEEMSPIEIVDHLGKQGINLDMGRVIEHLCVAFRHCLRRHAEEVFQSRLIVQSRLRGPRESQSEPCGLKGGSDGKTDHIWVEDELRPSRTEH